MRDGVELKSIKMEADAIDRVQTDQWRRISRTPGLVRDGLRQLLRHRGEAADNGVTR